MKQNKTDHSKVKAQLEADLGKAWEGIRMGMRIGIESSMELGDVMIRAKKELGFKTHGKTYAWVRTTLHITQSDQSLSNYRRLAENRPRLTVVAAEKGIELYSLALVEALESCPTTTGIDQGDLVRKVFIHLQGRKK